MILSFTELNGDKIDVCSPTLQLFDKGEKSETYDNGVDARYHIMVGEGGWCHRLSREEYERLHKIMTSTE